MHTKIRSHKTAILLASLGLGLGALALRSTSEEPAADEAEGAATGPRSRRLLTRHEPEALGPCAFSVGTRMAYDVETRTRTRIDMGPVMQNVEVDMPGMAAKATAIDQEGSRRWHVDLEAIARATDGSAVLAAHIEAQPLRVANHAVPPSPALADTFVVQLDPQCSIRELGWRTDGDLAAARDQQALLVGLGWLAPHEDEPSYTGSLLDPVGRYHAAFTVRGARVEGRAVDYRESFGRATGGLAPTLEVLASAIEIEPREGEWFASLSNARTLSLTMQGLEIGQVESSVSARSVAPGAWQPEVALDDGGWSWGLLLGAPTPRDPAKDHASSALAGVSVEDAVSHYLALVHEGRGTAQTVAYLTEWLQANEAGAGELVALLRAGAFEGEPSGTAGLFLALGKANTPGAAAALVGIIEGPGDAMEHKISAAHALSKIEAPTEAMIDAVVAVAEGSEVHPIDRGSLAMTLGAFAHHNAERAPELAAKAREQIEGWLAQPADPQALSSSLLAAGNAGHDGLAPAIAPYLDHEDPQIRQRAAHAMRHMSPEEAYPRLSSCMDDEDATVRASALETMSRVSRAHGIAPPDPAVDLAIEQLDLKTPTREHKALLTLLGDASTHGNVGAQAVLQQHFDDELHAGTRNVDRLRALGQHTRTSWTAE